MTYCVGLLLKDGLVMIADTRTNAGVDNIAVFRKLHLFETPGQRTLALCSAGNLSHAQTVVSLLNEGMENPATGKAQTLAGAATMLEAAQLVGRAVRHVYQIDGEALEKQNGRFDVSFLLGGQIKDRRLRLFLIYAAGNFIEASLETPFLQIGEHKYGKPILDRAVTYDMDLYDALKIGLISVDSTLRSNLAVGLPLDIAVIRRDALKAELTYRVEAEDAYFADLRRRWSEALRATHQAIPRPPYKPAG
ncbi:MAG: peptidase [Rhodospirillaceae bacterium]|nr:peptidase [Rhodospirillaceae bacterium]